MKQRCINVVSTLSNVVLTLCNVVSTLFQRRDEDQVKKAIFKYKSHPSIILIKNKITVPELFAFTEASVCDIEKELSNLNVKKASTLRI